MSSSTNLNVTASCSDRLSLQRDPTPPIIAAYWRPIVLVFLPFAAGYFLSYFFRTINAVIAGQLTAELGLDASHLGLMTSVYFLTFAAIQLPLGVLLDRFGLGECKADYSSLPRVARQCLQRVTNLQCSWLDAP